MIDKKFIDHIGDKLGIEKRDLIIISRDKEGEEIIDNTKIKFIPLWKWLLVS